MKIYAGNLKNRAIVTRVQFHFCHPITHKLRSTFLFSTSELIFLIHFKALKRQKFFLKSVVVVTLAIYGWLGIARCQDNVFLWSRETSLSYFFEG